MFVSPSQVAGTFAMWAVRQSPYAYPDNLEAVVRRLHEQFPRDDIGFAEFADADELYEVLAALTGEWPEVVGWNQRKNGNAAPFGFVSRYDRPEPDNDFIDLGALWGNVARSIAAEERCSASAIEARSDATGTGAAEGESAVPAGQTPK